MSEDEFGDDLELGEADFRGIDEVAETYQASQRPPTKRPRVQESSPDAPDIMVNADGKYTFASVPEEDEIYQRESVPRRERAATPAPAPVPVAPAVNDAQLRAALERNQELTKALHDAQIAASASMRSELRVSGEVSQLRRQLDVENKKFEAKQKSGQDALAALKAELEEQKRQHRLEAERWATEAAFREQEMESTRRRKSKAPGASQWTARSPAKSMARKQASSSPPKKPVPFRHRGVHNSFAEGLAEDATTPKQASQLATPMTRKGKGRAVASTDGSQDGMDVDAGPSQDLDDSEPFSWSKQLLRSLFTHHVAVPKGEQLEWVAALPMLLNAQLPDSSAYSKLCAELTAAVGAIIDEGDRLVDHAFFDGVCRPLVGMIDVLVQLKQTTLLVAALSLLATLAITVRPVVTSLLLHSGSSEAPESAAVFAIARCLDAYLAEPAVAGQAALLLESLVWDMTDTEMGGIDLLLRSTSVFELLLRETAPPDLLERGVRLLMIFAGDKRLFNAIMDIPMTNGGARPALVERLASLLAPGFDHRLYLAICSLVSLLIIQHDDAITLLTKSGSLLARLVALMHRDSSAYFDSDGARFEDDEAELTQLVIRSMTALRVLHQLICSTDAHIGAIKILHRYTAMPSSRLMLMVGIGRFANLDPPEWMPDLHRRALEDVSEIAHAILEKELSPDEVSVLTDVYGDVEEYDSQKTIDEDEEVMRID